MLNFKNSQKGFTAFYLTVLILAVVFTLGVSVYILTYGEQKISSNIVKSGQAYYAAEAGVEDALLRLNKNMNWSSSYSFSSGDATVEIVISDAVAGVRTITATGGAVDRFRKIQAVYELSSLTPGLFYGAQVGEGGLVMENNSSVVGNVFSNGNVELKGPQSEVTNTIIVSGAENKIFGKGKVKENAYADICQGVGITGTLHANTISGCSYATTTTDGLPVEPMPLPIDDSEIEKFKEDAAVGGIIGSYSRSSGTHYLGPKKIEGNLTIDKAELIITGTIWVTGTITISNPQTRIRLDPSYGSMSGMIIGDGLIDIQGGPSSSGSGAAGSYLMYISTSSANPAIIMGQSSKVDILYSNTGWISIGNKTDMRSINAYGIYVSNNATLTYEIGLADAFFTSGPGAGWKVASWREIE